MPALANPPLGLNACRFGGRWVNPRADPVQTRGRIRLQHPEPAVVCLTSGGWTRTSGVRVLRELRRIIANCNYSRHLSQNQTVASFDQSMYVLHLHMFHIDLGHILAPFTPANDLLAGAGLFNPSHHWVIQQPSRRCIQSDRPHSDVLRRIRPNPAAHRGDPYDLSQTSPSVRPAPLARPLLSFISDVRSLQPSADS